MNSRAVRACELSGSNHDCAGPASELGDCIAEVECSKQDTSACIPIADAYATCILGLGECSSLGTSLCGQLCDALTACGGPDVTSSILARCLLSADDPECMIAHEVFSCYGPEVCQFVMGGGGVPNPGICIGEVEGALMTCPWVTCGDGYIVGPEDCDDGNLVDGDGCNSTCR
jgi:cysteine-rich repeat protein